ncbi:MAG TPA: class I SAM-dependent methyltransferase [Corynebacteriales bacterium]|nr:class I SAM-dependent methyltransferase [Mycobacteriales bacterium]
MAFHCTAADVAWWGTTDVQEVIAAAESFPWTSEDTFASTTKLRKQFPDLTPAQVNSVIELVQARRLAAEKLGDETAAWLLTKETVQQATARPVVDHRADRLAAACAAQTVTGIHDATCSIGTEVAALLRKNIDASGSDIDEVRLAMAKHNVPAANFQQADALTPTWSADTATLIDPARRSSTGRRLYRGPEATIPTLTAVLETYRDRPYVIKAAPGIDWEGLFHDGWGTGPWSGEVEIVSITGSKRGGVKEAALWSTEFADEKVNRRATVLAPDGAIVDTVTDHPENISRAQSQDIQEPGSIIVEPDGAIVRSGLVREWGALHGLWLMDEYIAHLSGDNPPVDVPYYQVQKQLRFHKNDLKKAFQKMPTSALEVLVRGIELDPALVRKQVLGKPVKDAPARTLIVTRIGDNAAAFICSERRVG